jgi:hypothetical protein
MDQQHPGIGIDVDDIQLRAGVIPSMLLDTVPPEEVFPIKAMGDHLPSGPMATCEHPMPSRFHLSEAGKACCSLVVVRDRVSVLCRLLGGDGYIITLSQLR